jgi:hypothetical protein
MKAFVVENRTKETNKQMVDDKIGIILASSVETAAKILGKEIEEKFSDDGSARLKTSGKNMQFLISLPLVDSPKLFAQLLKEQRDSIKYIKSISH